MDDDLLRVLPPGMVRTQYTQQPESIQMVSMHENKFVSFYEKSAIATFGLDACSVIMIASDQGAILAHIPPLPGRTRHPLAGDTYAQHMMNRVRDLFEHFQAQGFFPVAASTILYAILRGERESIIESQIQIMRNTFRAMGLASTREIIYDIPVDRSQLGNGTILIRFRGRGLYPEVLIQDHAVSLF
ncbi:hypothetical protein BJX99DRAFT_262261 [Aspergillus californicus]